MDFSLDNKNRFFPTYLFWLLLLHIAVWTFVGVALRTNFDGAGDMVETYVWGQSFEWGYFKHPPLAAWFTGVWFRVLPETIWSYSLLSACTAAIGLAGVGALAMRLMSAPWALLCVAGAALTPGFTTNALRFNVNTVALATWPWVMLGFVLLAEAARSKRWPIAEALFFAVMCTLAVLGKYFAGVLVLALLCASIYIPIWRTLWKTPGPYLALLIAVLLLTPHLYWLYQNPTPLAYARNAAPNSLAEASYAALRFMLTKLVYLLPAFILALLCIDRGLRWLAASTMLKSLVLYKRPVWALTVLPILFSAILTIVTGARISVLWGLPMAGLTVVLLYESLAHANLHFVTALTRKYMLIAWMIPIPLAPLAWWIEAHNPDELATRMPYAELSQRIDQLWSAEHPSAIPYVGGSPRLAAAVAFYSQSHPAYWSPWNAPVETPWIHTPTVLQKGGVIACEAADLHCAEHAKSLGWAEREIVVHKVARSVAFPNYTFKVFWKLPA